MAYLLGHGWKGHFRPPYDTSTGVYYRGELGGPRIGVCWACLARLLGRFLGLMVGDACHQGMGKLVGWARANMMGRGTVKMLISYASLSC